MRGRRPGDLLQLREVAVTEVAETEKAARDGQASSPYSSNGNGNGNGYANGNGNGVYTNGNGNGNGSYASAANGNGNGQITYTVSSNGAAAATPQASPAASTASKAISQPASPSTNANMLTQTMDDDLVDPVAAGQLELAAATNSRRAELSSDGTPYKAPGGRWSKFKQYSVWQRTFEIWAFAIQFAWKYVLLGQKWTYGKEGMTPPAVSARKSSLAVWLREGLVKLGPTFIKIGQQFSTRVDVLSQEFVRELEKLQDNVPPFDSETAKQILETNLGRPVGEVFEEFSWEPIAAASLGQVHLAKLRGQKVVVKVQRPGLKELFDIDTKNIRALAVWLQKVDPKTDGAARDWVAIYDECSRILYQEIDYSLEGKNADLFRQNFKSVDWIKVPKVFWEFSTSQILTLEYCPGVKINSGNRIDALGLDRNRLARLAVESYLQQILRYGFFHADPHPGNVAVDAGVPGGRLIYYDFGMMGSIPGDVRGGLLQLFYGVYEKDAERCLEALIAMGVLVPTGDKTAVRRTADFFLKSFQERLDQQRKEREEQGAQYSASYKPQRTKDEAKERRRQILSTIGEDLLVAAADQPFRFPATFTFVVRSFTVLDGIGKSLNPRFDISEIAAPYARELLLESRPQFAKIAEDLKKRAANQNRAVVNLFKGPNKIEDIAGVIERLERGDLKLRVRALETERALVRVQAWQRVVACALLASCFVNVGTVLSVSVGVTAGATASFTGAALFGFFTLTNYFKVVQLEKKELQLQGAV